MPRDRWLEMELHVGDQPIQNWQPVLGVSSPMSLEQRPAGTGGAIEITVPTAGFDLCRGPPVKGGWTPWVTDREAELSFFLNDETLDPDPVFNPVPQSCHAW